MYLACLLLAWQDAFSEIGPVMVSGTADHKDRVRAEARRWLTSPYEAEDRDFVCEVAGLDPDWIAGLARRRLRLEREEKAAAKVIQIDKAFEVLMRKAEGGLSEEQVTAELERIAAMEAA